MIRRSTVDKFMIITTISVKTAVEWQRISDENWPVKPRTVSVMHKGRNSC